MKNRQICINHNVLANAGTCVIFAHSLSTRSREAIYTSQTSPYISWARPFSHLSHRHCGICSQLQWAIGTDSSRYFSVVYICNLLWPHIRIMGRAAWRLFWLCNGPEETRCIQRAWWLLEGRPKSALWDWVLEMLTWMAGAASWGSFSPDEHWRMGWFWIDSVVNPDFSSNLVLLFKFKVYRAQKV